MAMASRPIGRHAVCGSLQAPCRGRCDTANMDASSAVLEEIASLLLMLHESYFAKDVTGWRATLEAMVRFAHDASLSVHLSVLDLERLRRRVMKNSDDDPPLGAAPASPSARSQSQPSMGYGLFYEWLRDVATIIFPYPGDSGRKRSLHALLTQFILPLASQGGVPPPGPPLVLALPQHPATLDVLLEHATFLRAWFASASDDFAGSAGQGGGSPSKLGAAAVPAHEMTLPVARVTLLLQQCGVVPRIVSSSALLDMVGNLLGGSGNSSSGATSGSPTGSPGRQSAQQSMSFAAFLCLLEGLAALLDRDNIQVRDHSICQT